MRSVMKTWAALGRSFCFSVPVGVKSCVDCSGKADLVETQVVYSLSGQEK